MERTPPAPSSRSLELAKTGLLALGGALALAGFYNVGLQYRDFPLPYGVAISNVTAGELVFYLWYLLFGGAAAAFFTAALSRTNVLGNAEGSLIAALDRRWLVPVAISVLLAEVILFQRLVLQGMPIADDEAAYVFIARTLLEGRLANLSPGDPEFFTNQFFVLGNGLWYGKYPIGHPLLLALGELVGARFLIGPLVTAATAGLTYLVGVRLLGRRQASLAVLLLLVSPQFVFMGATELSHSSMAMFTMLGLLLTLRVKDGAGPGWALLAGIAWGYALLVRPLPGVLYVPVIFGAILAGKELPWKRRLVSLGLGALPVLAAVALLFYVNHLHTGNAGQSGYHVAHVSGQAPSGLAGLGLFSNDKGQLATSIGAAVLRTNFWLFGWPLSLLFVFLVRLKRDRLLFFGLIGAVFAYRFVAPKTCVATLGSVYVTEAMPLLALATAGGMARVRSYLTDGPGSRAQLASAAAVAGLIIALTGFLPVQLRSIGASSASRKAVLDLVMHQAGEGSLIFASTILPRKGRISWAIHAPNPTPGLDDSVIYVRPQRGPDGVEKNREFWQRRFPERRAFELVFAGGGVGLRPMLADADAFNGGAGPTPPR